MLKTKTGNANNTAKSRVNPSQLGQLDRLREQKRLIANYLPVSGLKFADGSPITYSELVSLARENIAE